MKTRRARVMRIGWCGVLGLIVAYGRMQAAEPDHSPQAELAMLELADPHLKVELVAAEPAVVSPVSMAWDASGRLYVAEMRDYPNAAGGGTIRLLEDRDHDGRYETSTIFAEGLSFPNSVLPWKDGVLVTAAPDLWFLRDTDGDGRADEKRILITGFGNGNQQLRVNGLTWGLDGWVYGANGRSDGVVHVPGNALEFPLRGRDFRFRPGTGEFQTLVGRSQFGLAFDEWGNRFLSWNTIPVRHEIFSDAYLVRREGLPATDVLADLLPPGDAGEVYPLTPPPRVFNNESSHHFNALAGLTIYRGSALGPGYRGNVFVGESLLNVIHRRVLVPTGVSFVAQRGETGSEFLRSRDPWFHPVNFATGPDECLYIADFHRELVEHPDFVPREMRERLDWRTGHEQGRIWRVRRVDFHPKTQVPDLARASSRQLIRALEGDLAWRRETAHRVLTERIDQSVKSALARIVQSGHTPESRLRGLRILDGMSALSDPLLVRALGDANAGVRAGAVAMAGVRLPASVPGSPLVTALLKAVTDPHPPVRLQAVLALGGLRDEEKRETALSTLLAPAQDPWIRRAALSSSGRALTPELATALWPKAAASLRPAPVLAAPAVDRQRLVEQYRPALQLAGDKIQGAAHFTRLCLSCHSLQGQGQRVGPDLMGIMARPLDALLVDILDPSRQVAPEYAAYEFLLEEGETVTGLFASESATRITVRRPGSSDENFAKSRVRSVKPTGRSLMPDGMETAMSPQQLADLLAFLREPDRVPLAR